MAKQTMEAKVRKNDVVTDSLRQAAQAEQEGDLPKAYMLAVRAFAEAGRLEAKDLRDSTFEQCRRYLIAAAEAGWLITGIDVKKASAVWTRWPGWSA